MSIKFTASSVNKEVFGTLSSLEKLTKQGLRRGMFGVGKGLIRKASANIISGTKTGRVYNLRRGGRKVRHQSSAAGETHANFTGALRRSLSFQLKGITSLEFGYGVSSGKGKPEYAAAIEFGYKPRNLEARPTLHNALKDEQGNMVQRFKKGIIGEFK